MWLPLIFLLVWTVTSIVNKFVTSKTLYLDQIFLLPILWSSPTTRLLLGLPLALSCKGKVLLIITLALALMLRSSLYFLLDKVIPQSFPVGNIFSCNDPTNKDFPWLCNAIEGCPHKLLIYHRLIIYLCNLSEIGSHCIWSGHTRSSKSISRHHLPIAVVTLIKLS